MNRIAQLRKEKGMNQQQLGKALGAAQNTISNWELGKRDPDYTMCIRLADFFGVSLDYLLGNSDYPGAPTPAGVQIPVLGNVQAGLPISAVQDILDYEEITGAGRDGRVFRAAHQRQIYGTPHDGGRCGHHPPAGRRGHRRYGCCPGQRRRCYCQTPEKAPGRHHACAKQSHF